MNCLIIDDEPLARDVIQAHVSKIPFLKLTHTAENAFEAIKILNSNPIDLIFLDIQMPDLTGLQLLKALKYQPLIIFTTAYPEYALESYEVNAVDYLVKPIPFERLLQAVGKAKNRFDGIQPLDYDVPSTKNDFIFVKTEYKMVRIDLQDIHYIESKRDYVSFYLENKEVSSLLSLSSVEEQLPQQDFIRIHRSFIIAIDKIKEIERNTLVVLDTRLQVGNNYREVLKKRVNEKKLD